MKIKRLFVALIAAVTALCGIAQTKGEIPTWSITASKFTLTDVPELYASYSTALPAMLNLFCAVPASRLVTPEEKRARQLIDYAAKKLALIRERVSLIAERDSLYLAVMSEKEKLRQTAAFNKKITAKEADIQKAQEKIDKLLNDTSFTAETLPVMIWKDGQQVFELPEYTNISQALKSENISAVIDGSIQDLSGYMYVSVVLTTGLPGMPDYRFSEAGPYQSIETIARSLAAQIMTAVKNSQPAKVLLTVEPEDAEVYVDSEPLEAGKKSLYMYEGSHRLEVLAAGYDSAGKTIEVQAGQNYLLNIKLKKENIISVGFQFIKPDADVFLHTQYFAGTPFQTDVPAGKNTAISFSYKDVKTYIVLRPHDFMQPGQTTYQLQAMLNKEKTKTLIDRRRNVLYWSLGAFYVSLPIFMILQGLTADMASAAADSRLGSDAAVQSKYRALFISSAVMQGITIGLGINYVVQLGLYLYAADQSIPKEARKL
ncbi:PEGA domain-containing protein [Treponema sp. OMZ 857]|uniref:PEGA domain-containing protein n=1 Tax=Treponema sp. OMZ 857 TaxID=1643513 RepID=UPI0020A46D60|nr:PEGA domain-containing protein [Treponema sp. OMZ 857]UTC43943.1 PEGA domain-containing protein [Treponema sp. OMZ 857]